MSPTTLVARPVDRAGAFASGLCAFHCAICGLLPTLVGGLGLGFLLHPRSEWAFTGVAIAFAATAMILGFRRHRSVGLAVLFLVGIGGLLASRWIESGEHHHAPHSAAVQHSANHLSAKTAAAAHVDDGEHDGDAEHDEHGDGHGDGRGDERPGHHGAGHENAGGHGQLGELLGITAGLTLFSAHFLSLRRSRRQSVHKDNCQRAEA